MPVVYVSAKFETTVVLTANDDFVFGEWTDKQLAENRSGYEKPNKGIWLQITNPEDSTEVFPIPVTEHDIYDGELEVKQDGRSFSFRFSGKAKVNVHKATKEKLDAGLKPRVTAVLVNGQRYELDLGIDATIQSKKL